MALSDIRFTAVAHDPSMPLTTGFSDDTERGVLVVSVLGARSLASAAAYRRVTLAMATTDAKDFATRAADAQLLKDLTRLRLGV